MSSTIPNKTCINCGSNKITFYQKYYQCDECQRKYRWQGITSSEIEKDKIEEKKLSCGYMDIYETHIKIYEAEILWEDIKSIVVEEIRIYKSTRLYIQLYLYNGNKYKDKLKLSASLFSLFSNKLAVESVGSLFFTHGSQEIIMKFFRELKENFGEKRVVQKVDLEKIEKVLNSFRRDGSFVRWFIFLFFIFFIISFFNDFIKY